MQPTAPRTLALKAGWQANGGELERLAPGEAARVLSASVGGGSGLGGHQSPTSAGGENENETPALSASESGVQDDLQTDNAAVRPFVPLDHEQQEKEDENEMRAVERQVEFPSCARDSREKAPVEIFATPLVATPLVATPFTPTAAAAADAEEQEEQGVFLCLSIDLSVCLSVCLSVRLSVHWSVCLSVYPSVYRSVCLSVCLSIFL